MSVIVTICGVTYFDIYILTSNQGEVLSWDSSQDADAYFRELKIDCGNATPLYPKSCRLSENQLKVYLVGQTNLCQLFYKNYVFYGLRVPSIERIYTELRGLYNSTSIGAFTPYSS